MYAVLSQLLYLWHLEEQRGREGLSHRIKRSCGRGEPHTKSKGGGAIFMREMTPQLFYQNYLPISASLGVKRVLWYVLYNISSY